MTFQASQSRTVEMARDVVESPPRDRQRLRETRRILRRSVAVGVLVWLSIAVAIAQDVGSGSDSAPSESPLSNSSRPENAQPEPAEFAAWYEDLGADEWSAREDATLRFLDAGDAAVEFLRSRPPEERPEVAARIDWLLRRLDPVRSRVQLFRLRRTPAGGAVEWLALDVTERQPVSGTTQRFEPAGALGATTVGLPIEVTLVSDPPHYQITATAKRGTESTNFAASLLDGHAALVGEEDLLGWLRRDGQAECNRESFVWVLWATGRAAFGSPPPTDPESEWRALEAQLLEQILALDPDAARQGAEVVEWLPGALGSLANAGTEGTDEAFDLSLRWLLDRARARQGDADAEARAVERCRNFVAGELPTEIAQDTLLALVELGSQPAIELLLERLSEFQNWENYRAVRALREHVERPEIAAAILKSFREPEVFNWLPWSSMEAELLMLDLQRVTPAEEFREFLADLLPKSLGEYDAYGGRRIRTLLTALLAARRTGEFPPESWLEPVIGLLSGDQSREAFFLLREAWLAGELDTETWDDVLESVAAAIESDTTRSTTLNLALRPLVTCEELDVDQLRAVWKTRLASFRSESGVRSQVDRELETLLGRPDGARPPRNNNTAWLARQKLWEEKVAAATRDELLPPREEPESAKEAAELPTAESSDDEPRTPQRPRSLRLTEAEFRVEGEGEGTLVSYRSRVVPVARSEIGLDLDLRDRSTHIEPPRTTRSRPGQPDWWRLNHGRNLQIAQPLVTRGRSMHRTLRYSDSALGARSVTSESPPEFVQLLLIELPESDPKPDWPTLRSALLDQLSTTAGAERDPILEVIRRLHLNDSLPTLRALYAEEGGLRLARVLLELGDAESRADILQKVREDDSKDRLPAVELLESLIQLNDLEAVDLACEWIITGGRTFRRFTPRLVQAISRAVEVEHLDAVPSQSRLFEAMIVALERSYTIRYVAPFLEKHTGEDFGSESLLRAASSAERTEREKAAVEKCKAWWERYRENL